MVGVVLTFYCSTPYLAAQAAAGLRADGAVIPSGDQAGVTAVDSEVEEISAAAALAAVGNELFDLTLRCINVY